MGQLRLVKLHDDGSALLLAGIDGTEYDLPVCADLRAAIAMSKAPDNDNRAHTTEDPPEPITASALLPNAPQKPNPTPNARAEKAMTASGTPAKDQHAPLRPAEIQAQLRAGVGVADLAELTGMEPERIERYSHAIVSEREFIIAQVRNHRVTGLDGPASVGELADTRLRARGVEPRDAVWSARREIGSPWLVTVEFDAEDPRTACWHYDLRGRTLTPLDDDARWLGQADADLPGTLGAVPTAPVRMPEPRRDETAAILEDLAARRGRRPSSHRGTPGAGAGGTGVGTGASAAPVTAEVATAVAAAAEAEPAPVTTRAPIVEIGSTARAGAGRARAKRTKATRAAMPSWDDIVLGPRRED